MVTDGFSDSLWMSLEVKLVISCFEYSHPLNVISSSLHGISILLPVTRHLIWFLESKEFYLIIIRCTQITGFNKLRIKYYSNFTWYSWRVIRFLSIFLISLIFNLEICGFILKFTVTHIRSMFHSYKNKSICNANQLTGYYISVTFAWYVLDTGCIYCCISRSFQHKFLKFITIICIKEWSD